LFVVVVVVIVVAAAAEATVVVVVSVLLVLAMAAARFRCAMMAHESHSSICTYNSNNDGGNHDVARGHTPLRSNVSFTHGGTSMVLSLLLLEEDCHAYSSSSSASSFSSSSFVFIAASFRDDTPSFFLTEGVELLHNNDIHIQNKTHLYCIRFARILQYYQSFD